MGLNRREFLKTALLGTTSALVGGHALGGTLDRYASSEPFVFPEPVHRTLGRTGMKVTVIGFGAMLTPEAEVMRVAFDHGVNYVDTARRYMGGRNEEIVGKALKGRRDKVYVATKTAPSSTSKEDITRDVETSLKALETDYIDVIQLHSLTGRERVFLPETREALARLKEQGKVRFFGVTTHKNEAEVLNALVDDPDRFFDTALVAYNFNSGDEVTNAMARAAGAGVGIIAMKALAGGYTTEAPGPISPHQAAIKWVLRNPNIATAIPGMKDLAQLKEDIAVMGMPFGHADGRALQRYGAAIQPFYCHLCGKCEDSCPKGVEISTINRSLMYAEGYGSPELALSTYREIPLPASASACLDCPACTARCVNGLDIPEKMKTARKWMDRCGTLA
ncbi:MAG: putative oxidoreductase of aldo/keto reductase family [Deltaproteobacteria bacterium]|nr:putative oxidoreductase of aldo/keto reductase family [Deltaproteobacteria bacterium]